MKRILFAAAAGIALMAQPAIAQTCREFLAIHATPGGDARIIDYAQQYYARQDDIRAVRGLTPIGEPILGWPLFVDSWVRNCESAPYQTFQMVIQRTYAGQSAAADVGR